MHHLFSRAALSLSKLILRTVLGTIDIGSIVHGHLSYTANLWPEGYFYNFVGSSTLYFTPYIDTWWYHVNSK